MSGNFFVVLWWEPCYSDLNFGVTFFGTQCSYPEMRTVTFDIVELLITGFTSSH